MDACKETGYRRKLSIKLIIGAYQFAFPLNDTQSGKKPETLSLEELLTLAEPRQPEILMKMLMARLNPTPMKLYFEVGPRHQCFFNSPGDVNMQPGLRTTGWLDERTIYSGQTAEVTITSAWEVPPLK